MKPKVIVFDIGNVLLRFEFAFANKALTAFLSASLSEVELFFSGSDYFDYECGRITSEEFFERFKSKLGYEFDYERFKEDFCRIFELDLEMFRLFLDLKMAHGNEIEFWILSNNNELHYNHLLRNWPGVSTNAFRVFLSHKMGVRKPDAAIYDQMLKEGKKRPEECVFIDDLEMNGVYPKQIGMHFIHFKGIEDFVVRLRGLGIDI